MTFTGCRAFFVAMAKDREPEKGKTEYQKIISGEAEPVGSQKGWSNLEKRVSFNQMEPEKLREISRKGGEAVQKLYGEKKTAKDALEKILTLKVDDSIISKADLEPELAKRLKRSNPDATLYDLMQLVAVGRAVGGNMKAYELIRDTYGDAPVKQVEITENITTDADRALLKKINDRLEAGTLVVVEDQTAGNPADDTTENNIKKIDDPE